MKAILNGITITILLSCSEVVGQADGEIPPSSSSLNLKIEQIAKEYEQQCKKIAEETTGSAANIKPNEANQAEIMVNFDVDITWDVKTFKIGLPEVKLEQRKVALDLPQVGLENRKMSFDVPVTKMERKRIGEKPEITVRWVNKGLGVRVPKSEVTMTPIYADVPVVSMERREIVAGVPKFEMQRKEFSIAVPEFTTKQHEIKVNTPRFTIRQPRTEIKKASEQATALEAETKKRLDQAKETFESEAKKAVSEGIHQTFAEVQKALLEQAESLQKQLEAARVLANEAIKNLRARGMQENDPVLKQAIIDAKQMEEEFQTALNQTRDQLVQLAEQEKQAVESALNSLNIAPGSV